MDNKKKLGLLVLLLALVIGLWMYFSKEEETVPEEKKVDELIKTDKERSDSMKKALGIE